MNLLWGNSSTVEMAGWTLVHFVWQGAALALVLWMFLGFTRNPRVRYAAACLTLLVMTLAPVYTYLHLSAQPASAVPHTAWRDAVTELGTVASASGSGTPLVSAAHTLLDVDWLRCLVMVWVGGVSVFAIRAAGGALVVRKLLREKRELVEAEWTERFVALEALIGLGRTIRYFRSHLVESPAVVGWFRPVVLLPVSALTGLSTTQIEAVIVHELAHIKRLDAFVNLFQLAVESVLFYHPAVWWVSRVIRQERENCCDDFAVALTGNPSDYVRALTLLGAPRAEQALLLAASGGSLRSRAARLLGLDAVTRSVPQSGVLLTLCLCATGVLLAAAAGQTGLAAPPAAPETRPAVQPRPAAKHGWPLASARQIAQVETPPLPTAPGTAGTPAAPDMVHSPAPVPAPAHEAVPAPHPAVAPDTNDDDPSPAPPAPAASPSKPTSTSSGSYIEELRSAGLKDFSVDELIALKMQGVSADYVRALRAAGMEPSVGEVIAMKVQGVSPEYIKRVRATWNDATMGQIIAMKVQGVAPEQASEMGRELGLGPLPLGQMIAFKVQGITPEYVRALRAAGLRNLDAGEVIAAKVQGITPEFIAQVRDHGFSNLTLHQLIGLKVAGVF